MKKVAIGLSAAALAISLATSVSAQTPTEGVHYELMREPLDLGSEVLVSVFSPGCVHCYRLEDQLLEWVAENEYTIHRIPFFFEDRWPEAARLMLGIQSAGLDQEQLIAEAFAAIHDDGIDDDDVDGLLAALSLDDDQVNEVRMAMNSSDVRQREDEIRAWLAENNIVVIPTVVINDTIFSDPARARGNDNLMLLLDYLNNHQ
jgi:protein dithiol oxidoreductase (disulfide-forming)